MKSPRFFLFQRIFLPSGLAALAFILLHLPACEDERVERDYPRVRTLEVTNITSEGARFEAEVYEPGSGIISEHGFAWAKSTPSIEFDNRVYLGSCDAPGKFSADISAALAEGVTYKVTAFVKSGEYTVYGNAVEFQSLGSLGPVITGFSPQRALCGDTIFIRGRNFSWVRSLNLVRFNDATAAVCDPVSDTLLMATVPFTLTEIENTLSVEIAGNKTTYSEPKLIVDLPRIVSISPSEAYWGDTVEIFLLNLRKFDNLHVFLGNSQLIPVEVSEGRSVSIIVPLIEESAPMDLSVYIDGGRFFSDKQFTLLAPFIERFEPLIGFWPDTVTLYGRFNPNRPQTEVMFGNFPAKVISVTGDSIKVIVPEALLVAPVSITYSYGLFESESPLNFDLPAPRIDKVTPLTEYAGGYVTITGDYFIRDLTTVSFNGEPSKRIYESRTSILCEAAGNINGEVRVSVSVSGRTTEYGEPFVLTNPEVLSFIPQSVSPGDTLSITCKNAVNLAYPVIIPSGYGMQVISVDGNTVKAMVPSGDYTSGRVGAYVYRNYTESVISNDDILTIIKPEINSVSPLSGTKGTLVTITGQNFSTVNEYNKVTFQGVEVPVISSTRTQISFYMPVAPAGEAPFYLSVCGHRVNSSQEFENLSAWGRLPDFPMADATCMMDFGDEILVAAPSGSKAMTVYRFNAFNSSFSPAGTVNTEMVSFEKSVVKGDKAYLFGSSYEESFLMAFNRVSMSLSVVTPAPGGLRMGTFLMDGDSVLYAGGGGERYYSGRVKQFWKYRMNSGVWYRLNDLPFESVGSNGFTVNRRFFVIDTNQNLWEYTEESDSWETRASYPGPYADFRMVTECGGKVYCGYGAIGDRSVYAYDPSTNNWSPLADEQPGPRYFPLSFEYEGKVYLGSGFDFGTSLKDFWVYDPSMEPGN